MPWSKYNIKIVESQLFQEKVLHISPTDRYNREKRKKERMTMYLPEIGRKIRRLRTQRGISQISLATSLGVSKSVISSYENGVHLPPYDLLIRIALLFGVSTDYLLGTNVNQTINVDGLTPTQIEAIALIVSELRER